jgi:hypothetical protein
VSTSQYTDDAPAALVAIAGELADDLQQTGLAVPLPTLRGAVMDAAMIVGADAATIVTLMQTPEAIRGFATWLHDRFSRPGDSIKIRGKRRGVTVTLQVDGSLPIQAINAFIADVLGDQDGQHVSN